MTLGAILADDYIFDVAFLSLSIVTEIQDMHGASRPLLDIRGDLRWWVTNKTVSTLTRIHDDREFTLTNTMVSFN